MTKKIKYIYFLYFLVIFLTYSPTYLFNYAMSDDWSLVYEALAKGGATYRHEIECGRPIYALAKILCVYFVKGYEDLVIPRALCVLTLLAFCCYLFNFLHKRKIFHNLLTAFVFPIFICFLPAIQLYTAWAVCFPYILSLLLAGLSYSILIPTNNKSSVLRFVCSIICLGLSFAVYQPTAMAFLFFVFLDNLVKEHKKFPLTNLILSAFIICIGMVLSFILSKTIPDLIYGNSTDRSRITTHILEKIYWFINQPLINAINNFNIYPNYIFTLVSGLMMLVGIQSICKNRNVFLKLLTIVLITIVSYAPCLLTNENWAAYRSLIVLELIVSSLIILGIFSIIQKLHIRLYALPFLIALLSISVSFNILNEIIIPQQSDLVALSAKISSMVDKNFNGKLMFYLDNPPPNPFVNFQRYDEFGINSSNIAWAVGGMAEQIKKNKKMSYELVDFHMFVDHNLDSLCQRKNNCIIIDTGDAIRKASYKY